MPPSQISRQNWAQKRIDEVYANNAHPYFARDDWRKGCLNAPMLRLNQETAPPNRPRPGAQMINATSLMGGDAFATAEDAADYLSNAAGKGAAPKGPGALDLIGHSAARRRTPPITTTNTSDKTAVTLRSARSGISEILQIPAGPANELQLGDISDQAHASAPIQASSVQSQAPAIKNPTGGSMRFDTEGSGAYHAPRKHGRHEGVDIVTTPGDAVTSPIDGKIVRHGIVYGDPKTVNGKRRQYYNVEIEGSGKYTGMNIKIFYIKQNSRLATGSVVKAG